MFTREHCGLCVSAKSVLSDVWDSRPFDFKEVDIVKPEAQAWKDLYDFDVPVVWSAHQTSYHAHCSWATHISQIHINKASAPEENPQLATTARKLMHRFTPEQVKALMDETEKE